MIPPPLLVAAWPHIKRALPFLAAVLALWLAYGWAFDRGHDSRDREVKALVQDRDTAIANATTLKAAVARQNAAMAALGVARDNAARDAAEAVRAGEKREREVAGVKARLAALARSKGACAAPVPDAVKDAWEKL